MSHCIEKLPHSCGSSDALQVFENDEGKYNGYCFACGTYVASPYGDKPEGYAPPKLPIKSASDTLSEIKEITDSYQTLALEDRKLDRDSLDYYGIRVGVSEQDGHTPTAHYYPYYGETGECIGYKVRLIQHKQFFVIGTTKRAELFGWRQALSTGGKRLFITEGELDCVALYQALVANQRGTKWEAYRPAVVSLTHGAASAAKAIQEHLTDIQRNFKEVVLVFDQDDAGKLATEEVCKILPSARVAQLPAKDPNACIIEGRSKALCNSVLFKAEEHKNTRLVLSSSLHEAARKQAEWGYSWPWPSFNKLTKGFRLGETIYIGAGVKMGKSELVNALAAHCIKAHGWKVFLAKPEEANAKSYKLLASKLAGKIFHDPEILFDEEAYDEAGKIIGDSAIFLDLYQHMGWQNLKQDIISAVHLGVKAVFIDPITNLVNGAASGDQNTMLQEIAQELAAMAKDLGIVIFIFCHLKAPLNGDAHERGGKVYSHQFAGSRAMMRSCNMMIGLEGNKDPQLEKEKRNIRKLVLLEEREYGAVGEVGLYWHDRTGLFNEIPE